MARALRSPRDALLAIRVLAVALVVPLITRLSLPRQEAILEPRWLRARVRVRVFYASSR